MGRTVVLQVVAAVTALAASGFSMWRWRLLYDDTERSPDEVSRLQDKAVAAAVLFLVAGIAGGASAFLTYDEAQREPRECRRILSSVSSRLEDELAARPGIDTRLAGSRGLSDRAEVAAALRNTVFELDGVDVEPTTDSLSWSTYDVRKDGALLGTVDETGIVTDRCDDLSP